MIDRADFVRESIDFLHRYMIRNLQKEAEKHGITVPQGRIIAEVSEKKTITIKQLTKNLQMSQSTVSDVVERLTTKGILVKKLSTKDKRSVVISLSEEASKVDPAADILNDVMADVLSLLKPNEQEVVEEGMQLILSAVKEKMKTDGMDDSADCDLLLFFHENNKK